MSGSEAGERVTSAKSPCRVRRFQSHIGKESFAKFGGPRVTLAQSFCSAEFFIIQIFIFIVEKFMMPENFSLTIFIGFTCNGKDFMFHIPPFFDVESLSDSSSTAVSGLLADFLFLTRAFDLCATTRRITYTTCILFARLFSQLVFDLGTGIDVTFALTIGTNYATTTTIVYVFMSRL